MQTLHLLYHELRPIRTRYPYALKLQDFESHLDLFDQLRQNPSGLQPAITFDDGHISNFDLAFPLLHARSFVARFFITAGWTGQKPGYMSWHQLRSLHAAGQQIGAHGWSHTLLTHCSSADLGLELRGARKALEDNLGAPVTTMSLPGGRSNRKVLDACFEAGYTEVFTSIPRAEPSPPGATIGRLNIRGDATLAWIADLFRPGSPRLAALEREYRVKAAAKALLGDRLYATAWGLLNREEPEITATYPAER